MSDTSEVKPENGASNGGPKQPGSRDICRDYLNKICNRGTRCKFYHPPGEGAGSVEAEQKEDYNFCIDYQNQGCYRENCRFVHAPAQDVEAYRVTGDVSNALARAIAAVTKKDNINGIPFCKEFQTQRCSRGQRCRYWHVNVEMERERRHNRQLQGGDTLTPPLYNSLRPHQPPTLSGMAPPGAPPLLPRRRPGGDPMDFGPPPNKRGYHSGGPPVAAFSEPPPHFYTQQLEQQNAELRRELDAARRDLQRERERYDALLAAFNPINATQGGAPGGAQQAPSQQQLYNALQPVPPPSSGQRVWGAPADSNEPPQPKWYSNYGQ